MPHDLRVIYRGNTFRQLLHFDPFENAWVISPEATTEANLPILRRKLRELPAFFLHVYPSSLWTFIDLVGQDLFRALPVRGILAGSETFTNGQQESFERRFGIPIAHWYGHSEYAAFAYCCRRCHGFHFYPTYGCVELLPSDRDDLRRIVASSFNLIGTQFVHYDTGDLASTPSECTVDNFAHASAIVGRVQEFFVDSAGRKRSLIGYIFGAHGRFWDHVRDLQFVQTEAGSLLVRLVTGPAADKALIESTLLKRLPMVRLEFDYVARVDRSASGKRSYVISTMGPSISGESRFPHAAGDSPPHSDCGGQPGASTGPASYPDIA